MTNSNSFKKFTFFGCLSKNLDEDDENKANFKSSTRFISHLDTDYIASDYATLNASRRIKTDIISSPILTLSSSTELLTSSINKRNSLTESTRTHLSNASSKPSFFKSILTLNRKSLIVQHKPDTETLSFCLDQPSDLSKSSISSNIQNNFNNYNRSSTVVMNITAVKNFEAQLGCDLAYQLTYDYSSQIQDPIKKEELKTKLSSTNLEVCDRDTSELSSDELRMPPQPLQNSRKSPEELCKLRKNKADEYYHMEEKQANLLKLLANNVYKKFQEENERQQYALCDQESIQRIFYLLVNLAPFAELVHGEIAMQIKERLEKEWDVKPYFGDILMQKYQYYRTYRAILQRFPTCQLTLSNMLKKKAFSNKIKQLLEAEAVGLEHVNRIDILFDRLVDFPRRCIQLLEGYLKNLEVNTREHDDIEKVIKLFTEIFDSSNEVLNRTQNFQQCYNIQYIIEGANFNIVEDNRILIKQGPIYKVSKRSGEAQLRHLSLFSDILLVCKIDKLRKSLRLNYKIKTNDLKLIVNTVESTDERRFRISATQNNEFIADTKKHKEDWIKAFRKVPNLRIIETKDLKEIEKIRQIGEYPPIWVPDTDQNDCSGCSSLFNVVRRRHHCRTCGRIYCHDCCNYTTYVKFCQRDERVCKSCYHYLNPTKHSSTNLSNSFQTSVSTLANNEENKTNLKNQNNNNNNDTDSKLPLEEKKSIETNSDKTKHEINSPPPVVVRRDRTCRKDEDSSSSSLNEDQLIYLDKILGSSADIETSADELESNQSSDNSVNKNDESTTTENELEIKSISSPIKPRVPPKPTNLLRKTESSLYLKSNRTPIHSEYVQLCKICAFNTESNLNDENSEIKLINNDSKMNRNWQRIFLIYYSDFTIGVYANQNELNTPSLTINLMCYQLNHINDTSFGLEKVTPNNNNSNVSNELIDQHSNNENELIVSSKNKLSKIKNLFEFNYELKFTSKDSKNKWYELLSNPIEIV